MREYSVPGDVEVPKDWSCVQAVYDIVEENPKHEMFLRENGSGWTPVSASEFAAEVREVARGIVALGIEQGDRVAIISSTRYEWCLVDFAIWAAGAVSVPIYDSSSAAQIEWILTDSEAKLVIAETDKHVAEVDKAISTAKLDVQVVQIEGASPAIDKLKKAGAEVEDSVLDTRRGAVTSGDMATIIYTSGTTGRPKGVILTHGNIHAEALAASETQLSNYLTPGNVSLMFLPLAHVLARAINYAGIYKRVTLAHTADLAHIVDRFGQVRPNYILSVPRVFEKVFNSARQSAHDGSDFKGRIFEKAVDTAVEMSKTTRSGKKPGPLLKAKHALFDKLVYSKLKSALGGRCEIAVSGGAPLSPRLAHFFDGMGVTIYEGYGLTETCAAHCVNTPGALKIGTVGRPLPGHAVRIESDGEVAVSGPVVADRYWNNEEASNKSFKDGWFFTGDLGSLDDDGFLRITGRKKEIIVTAGGKNVAPAGLEDGLKQNPLISEAVCVGDGRPFIGVLLTLDEDEIERWKDANGKTGSIADLAEDPELKKDLDKALDAANATVSHTEAIKKFKVLPGQFTEETGELTPSLKVKRNVVHDKFSKQIDAIYAK
ncbi:AMP-dependent synthetase/ligase [Dietzia sp.]|uniref:AMP-dependent synthetase/ligase n=1 Tax=Dietzia sp. TaxID=1871616 RepID=UPI002FDB1DDE